MTYILGEFGAVETTLRMAGGVSEEAMRDRSRRAMGPLRSFMDRIACAMAGGGRRAS